MPADVPRASLPWRAPCRTVGELPRRGVTISPATPTLGLEQLFIDDPLLSSVVVVGDGVSCITRTWFFDQLSGRLGYGRALYARQRISELPQGETLVLAAETSIVDGTQAVLTRPEVHRYDDVVISFGDGRYATSPVAELFAELAHAKAFEGLHDSLTGLPNRRLFFQRLVATHAQTAAREDSLFAVLFIDIDDFKTINDGLGHDVGDRALVEVAHRLSRLLAPGVTIARLGGDEFGMLIEPDAADVDAHKVAERISVLLRVPMQLGDETVAVSASVGVAVGPDGVSPDEVMRNADLAMYDEKHRRTGRYAVYDGSMHTRARERLELRAQLTGALERGEFRLVYQPIVELEQETIVGAEVLLRWEQANGRRVAPGNFIPMCEQTGMIVPVGHWVLREACTRAVAWGRAHPGHRDLRVSVNISPRQLQEPGVVAVVERTLHETGMPAEALVLEITESVLIDDLQEVVEALVALKGLGIRLALDDFGTGFSSLGYLARMPIDLVKLDRAFVSRLGSDADRRLLHGIVALSRSLGLLVVGEGVEEEFQVRELQAAGCQRAQGYYYARPMSGAAYCELLGEAAQPTRLPAGLPAAGAVANGAAGAAVGSRLAQVR